MLFIMKWLRQLWRYRRQPTPPPIAEPPPVIAAPPEPIVTEISSNRHERRQMERARKKYDKFVKPAGVIPSKPKTKTQGIPTPRRKHVEIITPAETVNDAEVFIADEHHENRNDIVAYKESEIYGEFNFRDTILQQLECYFVYLERMKKKEPDSYGYYREVGATLMPYMANGSWKRDCPEDERKSSKTDVTPLADWFNKTRPSFCCYAFGADPETEKYEQEKKSKPGYEMWVPKFLYFKKYKRPPPEIQAMSGGDVYAMTVWWDRPFDKKIKYGIPQEFGIFVSADGKEVVALRCCDTKYVPIRHKINRSGQRRGEVFSIPKRAWHIPGEFEKWAHDQGEDPQHFLTELFKRTVMHTETAQYSMTRVTATNKDGLAAVFSVNIHRTAYFFQDRDIDLTVNGKRKRIFHFVRPHTRHDGSVVKAHFRGERDFSWAGYQIKITVPGYHHFDMIDMDIGAVDDYWSEKDEKYLRTPELGKKLKAWMDEGKGSRRSQ